MLKGTIILTPFPFTDLSGAKVRPALVVYNQNTGEDCIVIFISSITHKRLGNNDLSVTPSKQNGLKVQSIIKINKIATIQKKAIIGEIGILESSILKDVDSKLKILFKI